MREQDLIEIEFMEQQQHGLHREILEFILSTLWLGIAFGVAFSGGYNAFKNPADLKITVLQSVIVVFFAFVLHELAHRLVARRYGHKATYRMWMPGLLLALGGSLFGMIFATPGGVHVDIDLTAPDAKSKLGKTALAGPVTNIVLCVIMAITAIFVLASININEITPLMKFIVGTLVIGIEINAWLAVFNLLPVGNFDGLKVFYWNKVVWTITFVLSIAIFAGILWLQAVFLK